MTTICIDCRYLRPHPSGIGEVVRPLVEHLPGLAPDWNFLLLRHASQPQPLSSAPNVKEAVLGPRANSPITLWWLQPFVDLREVDLFHAPANILPRGLKSRKITTIHDIMWLTNPRLCKQGMAGRVESIYFRHGIERALNQSDAILTVSETTREAICTLRPDLADRILSISPGVADRFRPMAFSSADRQRLGLSDRDYILTVGQNAPYKNHAAAIRAFAIATIDRPEIELIILQRQGASTHPLERLAHETGIAKRVKFLPPVAQPDLPLLYSGARALLHPSLCEGFGMPLAEAMACGCPVITSNISAMPEVTDGAALLVDPHNDQSIAAALQRVLSDSELASHLQHKGLERARKLDCQRFAANVLAAYRAVLDQ